MQYKEGYSIDGRYCLKDFVGSGSFGEVWVAADTQTDLEVAIKIYTSMDAKGLSDFKKEFQLSFDLNHANLLHANYLGVNPEDNRPYLVMPYCPDGSSTKLCGVIDEKRLWVFIRDVAAGLSYLHSQQSPIVHQDIKPDNILIKSGEFVITDFGISKQLRSTLSKSTAGLNTAGAVAYMGPERFSKQYQAVKASDIWSLGVTIYELATGDLPFCGMGGSMQNGGAEIPELPREFSKELNDLMTACLALETWNRPTAAQIAEYADNFIKYGTGKPPWKRSERGKKPVPKPFPKRLIGIIVGAVVVVAAVLLWPSLEPLKAELSSVLAESTPVAVAEPHSSKTAQSSQPVKPLELAVKSISLNKTELTLGEGGSTTLTAKYSPKDVTDKTTVWKSTDTTVAKVSASGKVTAVKAGSAAIIAICNGEDAYCNVTVKANKVQLAPATIGTHMGHEWVDLGLSVKWATCNVGASQPEDSGNYYAWGETMSKSNYSWISLRYCDDAIGEKFTKYNKDQGGTRDNKTRLEMSDDAANANWGGSWRMPSDAELQELIDKCTWTLVTQNGVKGYEIVSKTNGNSIFLPIVDLGSGTKALMCGYWSSSLSERNSNSAYALCLFNDSIKIKCSLVDYGWRCLAFSVRPVFN